MNLKEFLDRYYSGDERFERWVEAFPKMYRYARGVEVIPWREDFQVADKNPQVIDQMEFLEELYKNGMISEEEYEKEMEKIRREMKGYVSRTEGIAFMEENKVSFRRAVPSLNIVLHELGHCYFKEIDRFWSSAYAGGEDIMWLIALGKIEGERGKNEEFVKNYMSLVRKTVENPEEALTILNYKAREFLKRFGIFGLEHFEEYGYKAGEYPLRNWMDALSLQTGRIPDRDLKAEISFFLANSVTGAIYNDPIHKGFLEELIRQNPSQILKEALEDTYKRSPSQTHKRNRRMGR